MIVCGFGFPGLMWVLFNAAMLWWFWALCLSVVGCLFGDWLFIVGLGWASFGVWCCGGCSFLGDTVVILVLFGLGVWIVAFGWVLS